MVFMSTTSCSDIIHDNTSKEIKLIKLSTNMGDITIELFQDKAPETVANFLKYTKDGKLNGTIFHRVIPNFMIQGGGHLPDMTQIDTYDPIINESDNNISNKKGTIAMARTSEPHSANAQFFINTKDNRSLNPKSGRWGYAVFGTVIEGMEVVDKISKKPTGPKGRFTSDVPIETVLIKNISIE